MAMGIGAFKIVFIVATIAVAGGMIASQAFDVPALFGTSDSDDASADVVIPDTAPADVTPQEETVPPEQPSGETDTPSTVPDVPVTPVPTHVDISGMTEITGVTVIDVSGSYYIDGRVITAESYAAIDITADDVLIVIKGD